MTLRRSVAILFLFFVANSTQGVAAGRLDIPTVSYPKIVASARSAEGFVPSRWRLERKTEGDLNRDGRRDIVLVLQKVDPRLVIGGGTGWGQFNSNPRILVIAFAEATGRYRLKLENHALIPRKVEPSDDVQFDARQIEIANGRLRIGINFLRGFVTYTFRFRHGKFELTGFDKGGVIAAQFEGVSVNYLTHRAKFTKAATSNEAETVTWRTLERRRRLTIEQIGDGIQFDPTLR